MSGDKAPINQFRRSRNKNKEHSNHTETPTPIVINNDDDYEDEEEYEDDYEDEDPEPWNSDHEELDYTPIPLDNDNEYESNYQNNYDDISYTPVAKKKYRQSDACLTPLTYVDAKKAKDKQIRENYERRYSKYKTPRPAIDEEKTPNAIELSMTEPQALAAVDGSPSNKPEASLYFNKKTLDQYNDFEMNTYDSSDSNSNSSDLTKKYLKDPLTPAPNVIDAKNGVNKEKSLKLMKPTTSKDKKEKKEKGFTDRQKKNEQLKDKDKKKKKFTLKQFMKVDLKKFVRKYDGDNFDVAKAVCKHYDELSADTDTVTIVSDSRSGPNTAYWSKGDYNRVEKDCLGKYIMIYRACKHVAPNVKVKQDIFESCVKGLCMDNLGHSQLIADKLDAVFGEGCHVSLASHDQFEVFCRYSDGYICEVELPTNDFVVAWRR